MSSQHSATSSARMTLKMRSGSQVMGSLSVDWLQAGAVQGGPARHGSASGSGLLLDHRRAAGPVHRPVVVLGTASDEAEVVADLLDRVVARHGQLDRDDEGLGIGHVGTPCWVGDENRDVGAVAPL